jgi:hypothetical protein
LKDAETEAEGGLLSTLFGAGGTRMRKGLDINEVLSLAKQWSEIYGFGPAIGEQNLISIQMILEKRRFTTLVQSISIKKVIMERW